MTFSVVGDGLAGLMLAHCLNSRGCQVTLYGDQQTNTPPRGLVHLFAGRSFRRSQVELAAFEEAVNFWREEPLAEEFPVYRHVVSGDRLDRSADGVGLPPEYAPHRRDDGWLEYAPGFAVASQELEARLRGQLQSCWRHARLDQASLPSGACILAVGIEAAAWWSDVGWDLSLGSTVWASTPDSPEVIRIGMGLHIAPQKKEPLVCLGGRSSPLESERHDEVMVAEKLTGIPHTELSRWQGRRCAPALDRRPALGYLQENRFAFVGFGSRALFWLPYCVKLATECLLDGKQIPAELSVERLIAH